MNRKNLMKLGVLWFVLVSIAVPVSAQSGGGYDLSWSTVDNGGGISTGEDYALGGAVGQPDAGTLSGGGFELSGGFWRIKVEHPTAARVVALIARAPESTGIALAILLAVFVSVRRRRKPPVDAAG